VNVKDDSAIEISYAIELFDNRDPEDTLKSINDVRLLGTLVRTLQKSGGHRFGASDVTTYPPELKNLEQLEVELAWGYPSTSEADHSSWKFLDACCCAFKKQALQEVVDYRGPHGVRIVHNGVVDCKGIWLGVVGVGDALNGSVSHSQDTMDDAKQVGTRSFTIQINNVPDSVTDLYFVAYVPSTHLEKKNERFQRLVRPSSGCRQSRPRDPEVTPSSKQPFGRNHTVLHVKAWC